MGFYFFHSVLVTCTKFSSEFEYFTKIEILKIYLFIRSFIFASNLMMKYIYWLNLDSRRIKRRTKSQNFPWVYLGDESLQYHKYMLNIVSYEPFSVISLILGMMAI